jgi:hypothetical protein
MELRQSRCIPNVIVAPLVIFQPVEARDSSTSLHTVFYYRRPSHFIK